MKSKSTKKNPKRRTSLGVANASTVEYMRTFYGPSLRPIGRMPLSAHKEAGRLLKEVYAATGYRKSASNRVNSVRSELDEWAMQEYPDQKALPNEEFFDLYYHGPSQTFQQHISRGDRVGHTASLREVQKIVVAHYPDSAPLRALLKKLDGAINSLNSWI
jgi:hypothetical protein